MLFNPFRRISERGLLQADLVKAKCDRVTHRRLAEYHAAMAEMLDARVKRIEVVEAKADDTKVWGL